MQLELMRKKYFEKELGWRQFENFMLTLWTTEDFIENLNYFRNDFY